MPDPNAYTPSYDFSDFEADNPTSPKPGAQLDIQFSGIATSTDELVEAVKDIRRSDGKLKNSIVTLDSLSDDVRATLGESDYLDIVAENIGSVITVAAIDSDVTTVASISEDVSYIAGTIIGAAATDPETRNDGSDLQQGDEYFNTVEDEKRVYNGLMWQSAIIFAMEGVEILSGTFGADPDGIIPVEGGANLTLLFVNGFVMAEGEGKDYTVGEESVTVLNPNEGDEWKLWVYKGVRASDVYAQKDYAEEWAQSPEPISEAASGDGVTDQSSKTWARWSKAYRDQAAGYVNDIVAEKEVPITATRDGMESLEFPAGITAVRASGLSAIDDAGGFDLVRVDADPNYPAGSPFSTRSEDLFTKTGGDTPDAVNGGFWVRRDKGEVLFDQAGIIPENDGATNTEKWAALEDYFSLPGIRTKSVIVPEGVFRFAEADNEAAFRIFGGLTISGRGRASVIMLDDDQAGVSVARVLADAEGILLQNLCLHGNRDGQSAPNGLNLGFVGGPGSRNVDLVGVLIKDVHERVFMSNLSIGENDTPSEDYNLTLCRAVNFGGKAFQFSRTIGGGAFQCSALSLDADSSAFEISRSEAVTLIGNRSVDQGTAIQHYRVVNDSKRSKVIGNSALGGSRALFCSDSQHISFVENTGRDTLNGMLIEHTDGDNLGYECHSITVRGNVLDNFGGTAVRVAVQSDNNGTLVDDVVIEGNEFSGGATGIGLTPNSGMINVTHRNNIYRDVLVNVDGLTRPSPKQAFEGINSGSIISLADDTAASIPVPAGTGMLKVVVDNVPQYSAQITYRATSSASRVETAWNIRSDRIETATGALSGTTGNDAVITISPHTDGNIYVENRTGEPRTIRYLFECTP